MGRLEPKGVGVLARNADLVHRADHGLLEVEGDQVSLKEAQMLKKGERVKLKGYQFPQEEIGQEDAFYDTYDSLERAGYTIYAYEMTDKGWTEF